MEWTLQQALEYYKEDLKDGKCSDDCDFCNAEEQAIKALEYCIQNNITF